MKLLPFLIIGPLCHAMDPVSAELANAGQVNKNATINSVTYSTKVLIDDHEIEYCGTQFLQGSDKKAPPITCTRTKLGKYGSEITEGIDEKWFDVLKSLYEKQNKN